MCCTLGVAQDFSITIDSLGVGNTWTAGVVTPLHVTVTSNRSDATAAWVQWEVPDANGDTVLWGKPITLSPEGKTSTWLYAPLRPWADASFSWDVRLKEWDGNGPTGVLATTKFSSNSVQALQLKSSSGCIAVFGTRRVGLTGYQSSAPYITKQESTTIVSGLTSAQLPDAWPALEGLDAIVWADSPPEFTYRQELAVEEWVNRGGHLVISLPMIGDPWNLGSENGALSSLIGDIQVNIEDISIREFDQILGRNRGWPEIQMTTRTFNVNNQQRSEGRLYPLVRVRSNNKVIGVQKRIGFGAVTLLGIDLTNGQLASLGLPETDVFWNRILGRRSDTPSQSTVSALDEHQQLSKTIPTETTLSTGELVAQEIAMSTTAGGRLGTVFIIILLYWVLSCPVVYFLLKRKQKQRWAWMTFAMIAVAFSFVTWGIASTTATIKTPLKHFTIVDHVFGGNGQRAVGWCSIFLPTFGTSSVQLEGGENNLLLPWASPFAYKIPPFVDRQEILIDLQQVPHTFGQPSRATTSNFSYDWIGGIDHSFYDSLIRATPNNEPTLIASRTNPATGSLQGSIVNNITSALQNVTIVWVTNEQLPVAQLGRLSDGSLAPWVEKNKSGQALNKAFAWRVSSWKSGETIDFASFDASPASDFSTAVKSRYKIEDGFGRNSMSRGGAETRKDWRSKMEMLSLYSHLQPPTYQKSPDSKQGPSSHHSTRTGGHNLNFAEWFGRPCIIVMGFIQNAPIPVPISVDGEQNMQSTGETFVRWVYPLGDTP